MGDLLSVTNVAIFTWFTEGKEIRSSSSVGCIIYAQVLDLVKII